MKEKNKIDYSNLSQMEKMGLYIKDVRENRINISQEKLADKLGVTRQTISKWERGINAPDIMMLKDICKSLNISIYELLDGEDKSKKYEINDVIEFKIKGMKFYISKGKVKIIKISMSIFGGIIIFLSLFLFLFNYYRWNKYEVSGDDVYYNVSGYVITNKDESIYNIGYLSYVGDDINTVDEPLVKELELSLLLDGKQIYSYSKYNDEVLPIHYCLKNMSLIYNTKNKDIYDKKRKLRLMIRYIDVYGKEYIRTLDIE